MSTRSRIAVMHGDVCKSVYCHSDGYLSYTGRLLLDNYGSNEANDLVSRGDVSQVKPKVIDMAFYSRNGEYPWIEAHSFDEFLDQVKGCGAEYYYVIRDGVWYAGAVYDTDGIVKDQLVPLSDALATVLAETV